LSKAFLNPSVPFKIIDVGCSTTLLLFNTNAFILPLSLVPLLLSYCATSLLEANRKAIIVNILIVCFIEIKLLTIYSKYSADLK
jgi:hypothetical protein